MFQELSIIKDGISVLDKDWKLDYIGSFIIQFIHLPCKKGFCTIANPHRGSKPQRENEIYDFLREYHRGKCSNCGKSLPENNKNYVLFLNELKTL